jgi:hypothetical protein
MKIKLKKPANRLMWLGWSMLVFIACQKETAIIADGAARNEAGTISDTSAAVTESVFLVLDEESIDNGTPPNNFSGTNVNDQLAGTAQRLPLRYFRENIGRTIDLYSGEVGDEGWHALKLIPGTWNSAGPTPNGTRNYLLAGPGLGGGNDNPELLLDKIPDLTPLRANGLSMLTGKTVLAIVYDGDVSTNYGPLLGSLKGATLGIVALKVLDVRTRTGGSSASLPIVSVRIMSIDSAMAAPLKLFFNPPVPSSSSVPFDINPPSVIPPIQLIDAY